MSGAGQHFVGNVSFGPARSLWEEQPSLRELYEQACAGLVRAECEVEELRAEVAMLEGERDLLRVQVQAGEGLGLALVKTIDELKAEVAGYRDEACRESCRDKAAADRAGGHEWGNL
jgi:hypothetical protein